MAREFSRLVPGLQPFASALLRIGEQAGVNPVVTSTVRSHSQQAKLYNAYLRGQTPYPVAPPGHSAHEFGWAFDMVSVSEESQADLGQVWSNWGGTWGGTADPVHFELPGASASLRRKAVSVGTSRVPRTLAAAADFAIAFIPGIGEIELAAQLVSWGFPSSSVARFLANPVSVASGF